jgi:hypothetical protein
MSKNFEGASEVEKELLDRTRRMETRLHKICEAHGIVPTNPDEKVTARLENDGWVVIVEGMDVPLSSVRRAINQAVPGKPPKDVPMYLGSTNELLGYIDFT